jgi:hypothetical protein
MVSFYDHFSLGVCLSSIHELEMTSPHKPGSQFHPNFTGVFLWCSSLKFVQKFLFHATLWLPWQAKEKTFKKSSFIKPRELELRDEA